MMIKLLKHFFLIILTGMFLPAKATHNRAGENIFVGLQESSFDDGLIFPNPTSDLITVALGNENKEIYSADIFDVSGKKIKTFLKEELSGHLLQLSLNDLSPGLYMLMVTGNGQTITKKIIKQ